MSMGPNMSFSRVQHLWSLVPSTLRVKHQRHIRSVNGSAAIACLTHARGGCRPSCRNGQEPPTAGGMNRNVSWLCPGSEA